MALVVDRAVQQLSGSRPLRQGRGESQQITRTAQILTIGVLTLWLGAQWGMGAPIPWIGAAMWLFGLGAVMVSPAQRFNLLWFVKSGVAVYALAVIGSRLYLNMTQNVSPETWASMVGIAQTAVNVVSNTRGNVTTVIIWALWLVIPLGYFSIQKISQVHMNESSYFKSGTSGGKSCWIVFHTHFSSILKKCTIRLRMARIKGQRISGYCSSTSSRIWLPASPMMRKFISTARTNLSSS